MHTVPHEGDDLYEQARLAIEQAFADLYELTAYAATFMSDVASFMASRDLAHVDDEEQA